MEKVKETVILGFSGGVDSSVCAFLLRQQGYNVVGLYLDNADENARDFAQAVADFMGIELIIRDVHVELDRLVCTPFAQSYIKGETPNPCILCNPALKFKTLIDAADEYGAYCIATGHYAKKDENKILKGHPENDQSYMLGRLTNEQAERLLLPLGEYPKRQVRQLAAELNLPTANKPDSMEICFIPDKDYIGWIERRLNYTSKPGDFVFHGEKIGEHKGIIHYTVGQRMPGLYNERKLYISQIHPEDNSIELALWEELFKTVVTARNFNWIYGKPEEEITASVKVRHTKWENPSCTVMCKGDLVEINCSEPVRAPAPGQSAALYDGDVLLGSGFIV